MLDLITKIADLLFDYSAYRKDDRKYLLEKLLEPAMNDLTLLHQNYVETFMGYCKMLETGHSDTLKNHPVFKSIISDAIITRSLRDKIYSFYDSTNFSSANQFVNSIGMYFANMSTFFDDEEDKESALRTNQARYNLYALLVNLTEKEHTNESQKMIKAVEIIKMLIGQLQDRYKEVVQNYNTFKNSMIK